MSFLFILNNSYFAKVDVAAIKLIKVASMKKYISKVTWSKVLKFL